MEGRYDSITGKMIKDIMSVVKDVAQKTSPDKPKYKGKKVYFSGKETAPSAENTPIRSSVFGKDYEDSVSDLQFLMRLYVFRDESLEWPTKVDGFQTEDDLDIVIMLNPKDEPKSYSGLMQELKFTIRHEIEHLTQRGPNVKPGKKRNFNYHAREKAMGKMEYKYLYLADEMDANIAGLYARAKHEKKPFKDVVKVYLQQIVDSGKITPEQMKIVYSKWKARAKKIGGLPPL